MNSAFSPDKEYLKWFAALSAIPHESGNERALGEFLVAFAKERGLFVMKDATGNVHMKKPGTAGGRHSAGAHGHGLRQG